jgi:hypothetical protein
MEYKEIDVVEEVVNRATSVYFELIEMLREKHPELIPLYNMRFEYTDKRYPPAMRLHNAYEIIRTWNILKSKR